MTPAGVNFLFTVVFLLTIYRYWSTILLNNFQITSTEVTEVTYVSLCKEEEFE